MKMRELYRLAVERAHPGLELSEENFQFADSVAPSMLNEDVPEELVDTILKRFIEEIRKIDKLSESELRKRMHAFLNMN